MGAIACILLRTVSASADNVHSSDSPFYCHASRAVTPKNDQQKSAKFLIIKALSSSSHDHVKGFLSKFTVFKVHLLYDHQIYCLRACMCALFSPEILQAGAGLKRSTPMINNVNVDVGDVRNPSQPALWTTLIVPCPSRSSENAFARDSGER